MTGLAEMLLLAAPGLPLLLTLPGSGLGLRWRLPLALLPAAAVLFLPAGLQVALPWMLLGGSGLGLDAATRGWLAAAVLFWALLIRAMKFHRSRRTTTLALLALAGQLGAILSVDAAGFLCFSSLMGYAFCGLLAGSPGGRRRRAARTGLVLLVFADVLLFEALLFSSLEGILATARTAAPSNLYLVLVVLGFGLRAAFWPYHHWLLEAGSGNPSAWPLLGWTLPVTTGVLGLVRWLPPTESSAPLPALLLLLSAAGALAGTRRSLTAVTGLLALGTGLGLLYPGMWAAWGQNFALAGIAAGAASLLTGSLRTTPVEGHHDPSAAETAAARFMRFGETALPRWRDRVLARFITLVPRKRWQQLPERLEAHLRRWTFSTTLFVVLAVLLALLARLSGTG